VKYPTLPSLSTARFIQPKIDFLTDLGVKRIGRVIEIFPPLIGLRLDETLRPLVEYLRSLGVTKIATVIERVPPVFGLVRALNLYSCFIICYS
jgi:hypothetical protein